MDVRGIVTFAFARKARIKFYILEFDGLERSARAVGEFERTGLEDAVRYAQELERDGFCWYVA